MATIRAQNKRSLEYQIKVLENVGEKLAVIAQDYKDPQYQKYEEAFATCFQLVDLAQKAVVRLEAML